MNKLIAVVDDEEDLLNAVKITLEREQWEVKTFTSGAELFKFLKAARPVLFILDIMLPAESGFDICKTLRAGDNFKHTPVIFLSARNSEFDKVFGLELGADDYITKPFSPRELAARVKALLRRYEPQPQIKNIPAGGILIDKEKMEVYSDGRKIFLTLTEFKILELLVSKKGKIFSRDQIMDHIWSDDKIVSDRTIDVHINNLRQKLGRRGRHIQSVRSVGYKFNA
ncbi:MAG: response regulator transcription factor [Elusimicrobiota bacterium]|jgi:DNA-binding response OmpR family regulator|nr:response regulator transcription factor [Elusimicrobiota bacterium]